jgi:hypothetical protein
MTTALICFVDTETTDIGPRRLAWEMAIIRREMDGTRRELQAFIEVDLSDANPFALGIGRFYDRHPLGKWHSAGPSDSPHPPNPMSISYDGNATFEENLLVSWIDGYLTQANAAHLWCQWTYGAHIIGAVPNFDTEVMAAAARQHGLTPAHHYHLCDIENLIVGYLTAKGDRRLPPWNSDDLFAAIGVTIPDDEKHTAIGDARSVERAWDVVMGDRQPSRDAHKVPGLLVDEQGGLWVDDPFDRDRTMVLWVDPEPVPREAVERDRGALTPWIKGAAS